MTFYHWEGEDLVLFVHVQPRASRAGIVGVHGDKLKVKITSAPVDKCFCIKSPKNLPDLIASPMRISR